MNIWPQYTKLLQYNVPLFYQNCFDNSDLLTHAFNVVLNQGSPHFNLDTGHSNVFLNI